jgi:hypothetical protein
MNLFHNLKIHIPKNKSLIDNLNPLFQEIERLQMELKEAETLYKQLINELSEEAIPSNIKKQNTEIKEDSGTVVQIKTEEIIEQPKKKIIKFKKAENSEIIEQPKKNNKKEEITESIKKKTTVKKVKTEQLSL